MALESRASVKQQFERLSKEAVLDLLIPKSQADLNTVLENETFEKLRDVPARRSLFLDENATILLILKTQAGESEVENLLPNLEVLVSAYATDAVPQASGTSASASGKYDVTSETFTATRDVKIKASGDDTYVIWKLQLHLTRPKARLQRPAIYFTANLTINTSSIEPSRRLKQNFLESFEYVPANILAPLQFDPALVKSNIQMSEDRITKIAPADPRSEMTVKPIRATTKRAFPAVPALFTRTRYSSLPGLIIASMHIETSRVIGGNLSIREVKVDVSDGSATLMDDLTWPKKTRPGDEIAFMYNLQSDSMIKPGLDLRMLRFGIKATVFIDNATPVDLDISWQTHVDLSQPTNRPVYKWSRPLSSSLSHPTRLSTQSIRPPSIEDHQALPTHTHRGLTFTFTGPSTVHQTEDFQLHVQCVNRSPRTRRFAMIVLPPRKPRPTSLPLTASSYNTENLITTLIAASSLDYPKSPDVLEFNPDVRIGPLPPNASYELNLKFRAMVVGGLDLGVVRIVDLDSRQTIDVRELPDVISLGQDTK